jgi:hypothetical protein
MVDLAATRHTTFLCLDSNINTLKLTCNDTNFDYFETIHSCGYVQCINRATRIHNNTHSLIDHIITNTPAQSINTSVIVTDISDHFPVFVEIGERLVNRTKQPTVKSRNFSKQNHANFRSLLSNQDWREVLEANNVDGSYDKFWTIFNNTFELCFPVVSKRFNKNHNKIHKHMTRGLLISRATKLKLHKLALKHSTAEHLGKYRAYRNIYNHLIKASKKMYFDNSFQNAKSNPKTTWSLLGEALNTTKSVPKVEKIQTTDGVKTSPKEVAIALNKFFVEAGVNVANNIPYTNTNPDEFLPPPP